MPDEIGFPGAPREAFPGSPTGGATPAEESFDDVRFPEDIAAGAQGGPTFATSVIVCASGREFRNRTWRRARHKFEVGHALLTIDFAYELFEFFLARQGRARGFRFKWWRDYSTDQPEAGVKHDLQSITSTVFQLQKIYGSGSVTYSRAIAKPVFGTLHIYHGATEITTGFTCDYSTGRVTFGSAPGYTPSATFEFDIPVRFDIDSMQIADFGHEGDWQRVPLIEIIYSNKAPSIGSLHAFDEIQLPTLISDGSTGGPRFSTTVVSAESGSETRVAQWAAGRHIFDVSHALRDEDYAAILTAFFYSRGGRHQGFRFHYWRDYSTDQPISGTKHACAYIDTKHFQLQKGYGSAFTLPRKITKPVAGTVHMYAPATGTEILSGWSVDTTTGIVTFVSAPGFTPTARFEFDIPVRFDTDEMLMTDDDTNVYSWGQIPIVEIQI